MSASGVALAQTNPPSSPPTGGAPMPPTSDASAAPSPDPALTPAPAPPAPAPAPAAAGYYQPVAPTYTPPPEPSSLRNGMTFEANLGLGWVVASSDTDAETSRLGIGGLSLGVGGWLTPNVALTGRIAGVTLSEDGSTDSYIFFGPSLQYWINDQVWLGGGVGVAIARFVSEDGDTDTMKGLGADLRAGYTFTRGNENTVNISLELNPGHYQGYYEVTLTGIGILLGYQHL